MNFGKLGLSSLPFQFSTPLGGMAWDAVENASIRSPESFMGLPSLQIGRLSDARITSTI